MAIRIRLPEGEIELTWDAFEARVRSGRLPPDTQVLEPSLTGNAWVEADSLDLVRAWRDDPVDRWRRAFEVAAPPVATALLVGLNLRLFWVARLGTARDALIGWGANASSRVFEDGEGWRLLTMGFLHVDWLHVAFNAVWMAYTGWGVERAYGWKNLVTIFMAAVIGGAALSATFSGSTLSIGASGGVFGLVAAVVVFGLRFPDLLSDRARLGFGAAMLPYLILTFVSGLTNEGTDNYAHLGGLIVGIVLGSVLSPTGWSLRRDARIRSAVAIAGVLVMAAPAAFGPRLVRLVAPAEQVEVTHRVPLGWLAGVSSVGGPGWVSPGGGRAWTVRETRRSAPTPIEAVQDAWLHGVVAAEPEAIAGPSRSTVVDGREGASISVRLPGVPERVVTWYGVSRGRWVLEVTFEREAARVDRLAPLEARLLASVVWDDPPPLAEARDAVARSPDAPGPRRELARALADLGAIDEAIALADAGLAAAGSDADWTVRFEVQRGADPGTDDALFDRALAGLAPPTRIVDAVALLIHRGRLDEADGLLERAWTGRPGDRDLKRARRVRGQTRALDETGAPRELGWDPITRSASAPARRAALVGPTSLEGARVAGARLAEERRVVTERVRAGVGDLSDWSWFLRGYWDPVVGSEDRRALADAISVVRAGLPARDLPAAIADAVANGSLAPPL